MTTPLENAIAHVRNQIEKQLDAVDEAKKKLDLLIRMKEIKDKRLRGEKLTWEEVREVMDILCWESLAGCCSPVKECPWHLAACDVLGIDPAEFWETKDNVADDFLRLNVKIADEKDEP